MRILKALATYLRYDLPLWLAGIFTAWMPEFGPVPEIRGMLMRLFIKKCGRKFAVGKGVTILSPDRLQVGDDVYLARGTWVNAFGGLILEDEIMTGPYVVISTSNHGFKDGSVRHGGTHPAPVQIGKGSWIGAHAVVTAGVTIGKGVVVAANAVVTKDIEDNMIAGGIPAKPIKERIDNPGNVKSRHE